MTIERRFVAGIEDIKAFTLECKTCCRRTTCVLEFCLETIPVSCVCGASWRPLLEGNPVDMNEDAFAKLVKGLQRIRNLEQQKKLGVRVLFEFEEPQQRAQP